MMRSHCLSFPPQCSLFLTGGGTHVHVCMIVRGVHRRWRHGHGKGLALGMWGVRPGQGVCGGVSSRLWGHLVAPCRRRPWGRAALDACLKVAFGRRRGRLIELDGDVARGLRGAAASFWWGPGGLWVEVLAAVVAALRQAGAVECRVGAVHLFLGVALHKKIDWHHPGPLFEQEGRGSEGKRPAVMVVEELLGLPGPVHHLIINTGDVEHQAHHQTEAWEDEEDPGDKGQDGALRPDVSDVTDDEGREDKEQWHHREGRGCTHHLEDVCSVFSGYLYIRFGEVLRRNTSPVFWSSHEANSPEAWMQGHLHLHALVLLEDDALHYNQPVVCGHGHPHQQQPTGSKHCGQDGQRTAAARTHPATRVVRTRQ